MKTTKIVEFPIQSFLTKLGLGIGISYVLWFGAMMISGEDLAKQSGGLIFGAVSIALFFLFKQLGQKESGKKMMNVLLVLLAIASIVMSFVSASGGSH